MHTSSTATRIVYNSSITSRCTSSHLLNNAACSEHIGRCCLRGNCGDIANVRVKVEACTSSDCIVFCQYLNVLIQFLLTSLNQISHAAPWLLYSFTLTLLSFLLLLSQFSPISTCLFYSSMASVATSMFLLLSLSGSFRTGPDVRICGYVHGIG